MRLFYEIFFSAVLIELLSLILNLNDFQVQIPVPQVAPAAQVPGVTSTTTTTTTTPPPAAASGVKVFYLYWDSSDKVW